MKSVWYKLAALILPLALVLAGCGVRIQRLTLPSQLVLSRGVSQTLTPGYETEGEEDPDRVAEAAQALELVWTSSDEGVARVDAAGQVTAVGAGDAEISVTDAAGRLQAATRVHVTVPPTGISAPKTLTLAVNGSASQPLGAAVQPAEATDVRPVYESGGPTVATVDEAGTVTAVGVGQCTITTSLASALPATAETAFLCAQTRVSVIRQMEEIRLDNTEGILTVGSRYTIGATVLPADTTNPALTWQSSDPAVATVDETGTVTAAGVGQCTLTVSNTAGDVSASYALTVRPLSCSYCGGTGHTSTVCPVKAAEEQAAAQAAAAQQPAQAPQETAVQAPQPEQPADTGEEDPLVTNPWGITLHQSEWDEIYRTSGARPEDCFSMFSGIDWTQDPSCATNGQLGAKG